MMAPITSCAMVPTTISDRRGRNAKPDRQQCREQRETEPERGKGPDFGHAPAIPTRASGAQKNRLGGGLASFPTAIWCAVGVISLREAVSGNSIPIFSLR